MMNMNTIIISLLNILPDFIDFCMLLIFSNALISNCTTGIQLNAFLNNAGFS